MTQRQLGIILTMLTLSFLLKGLTALHRLLQKRGADAYENESWFDFTGFGG